MSKIKNGGLVQYGAEPFEQQQFGAAGVEGVNVTNSKLRGVLCSTNRNKFDEELKIKDYTRENTYTNVSF